LTAPSAPDRAFGIFSNGIKIPTSDRMKKGNKGDVFSALDRTFRFY
jgi:hypothetical protein